MRKHIAIFTVTGAGHVHPTLGLCSELVRRGHRVSYPTTERFAKQVARAGAEVITLRTSPETTNDREVYRLPEFPDANFWDRFASLFMTRCFAGTATLLSDVEGFYVENVPDLVVYDLFSFGGRILAKRLGIKAIQHWPQFAHQNYLTRENGVCFNPEAMIRFSGLLDSFLAAHGINGEGALWHKEELIIHFVPREFQFDAEMYDDRFCFVGPCLNRDPGPKWDAGDDERPLLLVSESTVAESERPFFRVCFEALANSEYRVVFSNRKTLRGIREVIPENFRANEVGVYNTAILPNAALTICQAGLQTTLESLYYGVPVLGVPLTPYHAEVSYRIAELGLGVELSERNISARALKESVDKILRDPAISGRVERMQHCIRDSRGASLAADRIETILERSVVD